MATKKRSLGLGSYGSLTPRRSAYSAQRMLQTYRSGAVYGNYGDGSGSSGVEGAAIAAGIQVATSLISTLAQGSQAKAAAATAAATAQSQAALAQAQAQATAAQAAVDAQGTKKIEIAVGGLLVAAVAAGGFYYLMYGK